MKKVLEEEVVISNIKYVYPKLPTGNELRIAVGALSLMNQKSNVNDDCHPMLCCWNENPAVEFADFQWWLKCRIEESSFVIGTTIIPFDKRLSLRPLFPETKFGEPSVILKFKDGTLLKLVVRDETKPIDICVRGAEVNFIKEKIKEYGYTPVPFD